MQVEDWLREHGLEAYGPRFAEHDIGPDILGTLSEDDLREIGLPLGARRRFFKAVAEYRVGPAVPAADDGEHRQITVLFCDIVDFTGLSTSMDPEDLQTLVAGFVETCRTEVGYWGGALGNYLGDGVLVYFGWPQAYEDAPQRAAHAALALLQAASRITGPSGRPLQVRIGMATGVVFVGRKLAAGAGAVDTVFGRTPILAARLEALACPGEILLDVATAVLLPPARFRRADLGAQHVKGFEDPIGVWRLDSAAAQRDTRSEMAERASALPIEGREVPLAQLTQLWDAAARGEGMQLVKLVGEAGIGKSHLACHFLGQCAAAGATVHKLHCRPYNDNATLYPVVAWLCQRAGLEPGAPLESRRAAYVDLAQGVGLPAATYLEDLGDLLDLAPQPTGDSSARRRAAWFHAIARDLRAQCADGPQLLVIEDIHWTDPQTDWLLAELADSCADLPLMILATTRPEFRPAWEGHTQARELALSRVERAAALRMVDRLTGTEGLARDVRDRIVDTSDGVPLFITELTRDVAQRHDKAPAASLHIPATLQGVLSARLDSARGARHVAQVASCLGRVFDSTLLAEVMQGHTLTLRADLEALVGLGLIEPQGTGGTHFIFRHALIQEVAYQSQPRARRRTVHGRIADRLSLDGRADPRELAHHLTEAARFPEAIARWTEAGDRAVNRAALGEAIDHYRRALDLLDHLPGIELQDHRRLTLLRALGPVLSAHDGYGADAVGTLYTEAAALAGRVGSADDRFAARRGLWLFHHMSAQYGHAEQDAQAMLALARDADAASRLEASRALGATAFMIGKLDTARHHLETAIAGYAAGTGADNTALYGDDPGLACMAYLGSTLWYLGDPEAARRCCADMLRIAEEVGHPFSLARSLTFTSFTYHLMQDLDLLLPTAERAALHADRYEFPFHSGVGRILWGWALCRQGDHDNGWKIIEEGHRQYASSGSQMLQPLYLSLMAGVCRDQGRIEPAWSYSQRAMAQLDRSQEDLVRPEVLRLHGVLVADRGDRPGGLRLLEASAALARLQSSRFCLLRTLTSIARIDPARTPALAEALRTFPANLQTPDLDQARAALDALDRAG